MTDLVTGAAGFVGAHLARSLAARGRRVRGLVHRAEPPPGLAEAGVEIVRGDLRAPASLGPALAGAERVFHAAALVSDWGRRADHFAVNADGTAHLLEAAAAAGARRFLHVSTTDVYGHPDRPVDETTPLRGRFAYGASKVRAEQHAFRWHRESDLAVTVVRPASIYGPGSESIVGEIADLLRRRSMVHLGRGRCPAGLCHVDNLVDVLLRAADTPDSAGEAYNVTDGTDVSWRTFTNALADALELPRPRLTLPRGVAYATGALLELLHGALRIRRRPLLTRMAVELFTTNQAFCIDKARRELGYEPRRRFHTALPDLVQWLAQRPSR